MIHDSEYYDLSVYLLNFRSFYLGHSQQMQEINLSFQ